MLKLKNVSLLRNNCFIQGEWVAADSGKTVDVTNPATGQIIGTVPFCGADETRRAIHAAQESLDAWRSKTAQERSAILRKWHDLLMENQEDLAVIMTAEQGKPLAESKGEISYAAAFFEWFAEEAKRVYGDVIPQTVASQRLVVIKQPVGVVAAITPWNFPSAMITRKAGAALAAGCTMVVKPATATPFSALAIAELGRQAGVPKGVFNVVTGSSSAIGGELTANPIVRKLTFTGSTQVGKKLMKDCADTMKRISMELGGNAPFIVFDDADIDAAVEGAMACKYRNSGQTCVCANRMYVQSGVYDQFCKKLTMAVEGLKVGNGLDDGIQQGPLIDMTAVETVESHINDAVTKGGKILTGGARHALGGSFFAPTVIADITDDMRVAKEETFGPLAPVFKFDTEDEVIRKANDTEFGLAAYFYTRDLGRSWRVGEKLEYGLVGINSGIISNPVAPFGGMKESGNGREGSKYGLDDYLEIKYLCMSGI
ncbi:NAD-dependent succinate-semialdehyde dehydrogenase [uncultured Desulfobacter sp.]|uniref:NAD-dependent succinate-semialdehyde dehydrogenase n=1 Tax=uncultured Desulfobacter sp. TaxID=240139 RepID=UPI002AAB106E|nr:NAD-dependent succinate-semialdehyde dehydrogenase [uncultured Desulfobacter sp.]